MPTKVKDVRPPRGLSRLFYRTPIWFYRLGLGGLLGSKFLLLNHRGRKSGLNRQAVLEVVDYQADDDRYIVNAGFGQTTQWYQNVLADPLVTIQVGRRKLEARASQLSSEQGGEALLNFVKNNPSEKFMVKLLGYEVDGTDQDWRALGELLIFIGLSIVPPEESELRSAK